MKDSGQQKSPAVQLVKLRTEELLTFRGTTSIRLWFTPQPPFYPAGHVAERAQQ